MTERAVKSVKRNLRIGEQQDNMYHDAEYDRYTYRDGFSESVREGNQYRCIIDNQRNKCNQNKSNFNIHLFTSVSGKGLRQVIIAARHQSIDFIISLFQAGQKQYGCVGL